MRSVFLCLLLVGCEEASGPRMALRFHPPAGAVFHYTVAQHIRVTAPPGFLGGLTREMDMRVYATHTVKGPAAGGGIEVDIVADSARLSVPTMSSDAIAGVLQEIRGLRNTDVYDDQARLLHNTFAVQPKPGVVSQIAYMLHAPSFGFPDRPIGRGDSWTVTSGLPWKEFIGPKVSGADSAQTTLTVREIRVRDGDTSVVIDIKMAYPRNPIRLTIGGLQASMKMSGDMGGYQEFSITRGSVVAAEMRSAMTISVTVAALLMRDAPIKSESRTTIGLADAR